MTGRAPWVLAGVLAAGFVAGFVVGGVGPRREIDQRDAALADLRSELEASGGGGGWRSPVPGLDQILRAPPAEAGSFSERDSRSTASNPNPRPTSRGARTDAPVQPAADAGAQPTGWVQRWRRRGRERDVDNSLETFQRAASIQRVRSAQSLAALREHADLSPEEDAEVVQILERMNLELFGHGEEILLLALDEEAPPARDLLGVTHDVTGILHGAQLQLEELLGAERVGGADPETLLIWNYVDLAQLEPAARAAVERSR